jgi:hypothetical protein
MDESNYGTDAVPLRMFIWGADISLHITKSLQLPVVSKDVQLEVKETLIFWTFW